MTPYVKVSRSNSWTDAFEEVESEPVGPHSNGESEEAKEDLTDNNNNSILNPINEQFYDDIRNAYANILLNWGMLRERCDLLKYSTNVSYDLSHEGLEPVVNCHHCGEELQTGVQCERCRKVALVCVICRCPVRGVVTSCGSCGHGGHLMHWRAWFKKAKEEYCPTGCGCKCLENNEFS